METQDFINQVFEQARAAGVVRTRADFADALGINRSSLSAAMNGNKKYMTDPLERKVRAFYESRFSGDGEVLNKGTLPVIPTEAMAGTLGDFSASVNEYECERLISPIRGADYAMKVCGDSMSPEYPSGCQILIKKINEEAFIEWGKVYVLDTENGAVIKKIRKTDNPLVVECVSLNPAYQPFTIDTSYINGWYKILMVLALK